jgi:hypothetical protein
MHYDDSYPSGGRFLPERRELRHQKNIVKMQEVIGKYASFRLLYLKRNIFNAINSHPHFDGGILEHTRRLHQTQKYILEQMSVLKNKGVEIFEVNYEDLDEITTQQRLADFLNIELEIVIEITKLYFKKSNKDYKKLLSDCVIDAMSSILNSDG